MAKGAFTAKLYLKHDHFHEYGRQVHLGAERAALRLAKVGQAAARDAAPRSERGRQPHVADAIEGRVVVDGRHVLAAVGLGKAWWGVFLNQGTKPHTLNHGGQHPGLPAQRFMQKGLEAMAAAAHQALREELARARPS